MKKITFPMLLVAGVIGLLSLQAMPVTALSASAATVAAADTAPATDSAPKPDTAPHK